MQSPGLSLSPPRPAQISSQGSKQLLPPAQPSDTLSFQTLGSQLRPTCCRPGPARAGILTCPGCWAGPGLQDGPRSPSRSTSPLCATSPGDSGTTPIGRDTGRARETGHRPRLGSPDRPVMGHTTLRGHVPFGFSCLCRSDWFHERPSEVASAVLSSWNVLRLEPWDSARRQPPGDRASAPPQGRAERLPRSPEFQLLDAPPPPPASRPPLP